jgi:hypothetical protein
MHVLVPDWLVSRPFWIREHAPRMDQGTNGLSTELVAKAQSTKAVFTIIRFPGKLESQFVDFRNWIIDSRHNQQKGSSWLLRSPEE